MTRVVAPAASSFVEAVRRLASSALVIRLFRYGVAGVISTALSFGAVFFLVELLRMGPVTSAALATALVTVISYVVNRRWVFASSRAHASAFPRFVAATVLSVVINAGLMHLAVHVLGASYVFGLVLATVVVPPTNFLVNTLWCFRAPEGETG